MRSEIINELSKLESESEIKILFAIESGSRAWDFASKDSDWDVRFVYIHKLDWYLNIDNKKDSYDKILPNEIDLGGWELKKALRLYRKSNPSILEWLQSPIIYIDSYSTAENLRNLSEYFFDPKSTIYHYLSMAKSNFNAYLQGDYVKTKKYLYALRPILACDWIKENSSMIPMEFHKLLDAQVADGPIKKIIQDLMIRKKSGVELNEEPKIKVLNDYIKEKIQFYERYAESMKFEKKDNTKLLDELFIQTLKNVWD